jgi:hypothetical protein
MYFVNNFAIIHFNIASILNHKYYLITISINSIKYTVQTDSKCFYIVSLCVNFLENNVRTHSKKYFNRSFILIYSNKVSNSFKTCTNDSFILIQSIIIFKLNHFCVFMTIFHQFGQIKILTRS